MIVTFTAQWVFLQQSFLSSRTTILYTIAVLCTEKYDITTTLSGVNGQISNLFVFDIRIVVAQ